MKNLKRKPLEEALTEYSLLTEEQRKEADKKLQHDWFRTYEEYNKLLKQDPSIDAMISQIGDIEHTLRFNPENAFVEFDYMANEGDPEFEEPVYKYSEKIHEREKYTFENWNKIQKKYEEEMKKLTEGNFVPFRAKRIAALKKKLIDAAKMVEHYQEVHNILRNQKFLEKHPEILKDLEDKLNKKLTAYAEDFLPSALEKSPELICYTHNTTVTTEKDLAKLCNNLREELLEKMRSKNTTFNVTEKNQQ